ncbi:uracil-DNA glycosylase [Candidatus Woesearchaeota archaeon]|nr:uracil-DNA glycosylase [Candidatus Woesearchaeota archaeon]|tara:strand:+ start:4877 stop:5452 length:576 start_codon:yes stop_codon:yes gene_type:complete
MEKSRRVARLKEKYNKCLECEVLVKNRTNIVFGVGDPDTCKVVIIGEAPGMNEDIKMEPFVGRSGQILDSLLADIGLKREGVYITNTILCRPPNNRNPNRGELNNCRKRLDMQIKLLDPRVVITLGNFASRYMLDTNDGITEIHGKAHEVNGVKIVPMFHPAVLLYSGNNPEKRKELLDDFMVVKGILSDR